MSGLPPTRYSPWVASQLPSSSPPRSTPQSEEASWSCIRKQGDSPDLKKKKKQRTGSIQKRKEPGKASSPALSCLLTLQSPAQGLTLIKPLTHISEWATKWVSGSSLNSLYTGFSRIPFPHQERPTLSELESEDFQQKSVAGIFKDPISDVRWNYGQPQEGWACPGNTY